MTRGKSRQNNGPCVVCGRQNSGETLETFRRLTENLLAKAVKSPAAQLLTFNLNLNDQLCQLYYNNFVVYDRGITKSKRKRKSTDLSYYPEGSKQKKVSLSQETYAELIQQIEDLEFQLDQTVKATEIGNFFPFFISNLITYYINYSSFKLL